MGAVVGDRDQAHAREPVSAPVPEPGEMRYRLNGGSLSTTVEMCNSAKLPSWPSTIPEMRSSATYPAPAYEPSSPGVRVYSISCSLIPSMAPVYVLVSRSTPYSTPVVGAKSFVRGSCESITKAALV